MAQYATDYRKRATLWAGCFPIRYKARQAEIAARCGISDVTVYHAVRDYSEKGIEATLSYAKRANPPRPAIASGEKEARIIALACGETPKGFARRSSRSRIFIFTEPLVG